VLQVGLTPEVSSTGFAALSKLQHLEQFIFGECMDKCFWTQESKYLALCAQFLPQLKVVGYRYDLFDAGNLEINGFPQIKGYNNSMVEQQLQQKTVLSLKQLNLSDDVQPSENFTFSELEKLLLWIPSSRTLSSMCERFNAVSALGLYQCKKIDVIPMLQSLGQNLHTLALCEAWRMISLAEVLQLCPYLKRFKVFACEANQAPEQWPEENFGLMEEADFSNFKLPRGFLTQVNANMKPSFKISWYFRYINDFYPTKVKICV